jgi:hypothetical protein
MRQSSISNNFTSITPINQLLPLGSGAQVGNLPLIEIDTLEYQETEKIETELRDVDRIRIRKVYACCPGLPSGGS